MKILYLPETDSLSIKLRTGDGRIFGEIIGEDLNENVIVRHYDAGALYKIEVGGSASKVFDLGRLGDWKSKVYRSTCHWRCHWRKPDSRRAKLARIAPANGFVSRR